MSIDDKVEYLAKETEKLFKSEEEACRMLIVEDVCKINVYIQELYAEKKDRLDKKKTVFKGAVGLYD